MSDVLNRAAHEAARVIDFLFECGYEADGHTQGSHYKIITRDSYPLAGKNIDIPGRQRFRKGNQFVTVGKRTACVYSKSLLPHNPFRPITITASRNFRTRDFDRIREWITEG